MKRPKRVSLEEKERLRLLAIKLGWPTEMPPSFRRRMGRIEVQMYSETKPDEDDSSKKLAEDELEWIAKMSNTGMTPGRQKPKDETMLSNLLRRC